ncbi:MAG: hypothetical protein K8I82_27170, partial [Anaerolineae bacterium]|nr:hypothetical protein [Anaerolineae bacterium]
MSDQIKEKQWIWYASITDEIFRITPLEIIEKYKSNDPLCKQYAWYNIIMNFAVSRAAKLGLMTFIRQPKSVVCPLCEMEFFEDSLPLPLVER